MELLNCPFCGAKATIDEMPISHKSLIGYKSAEEAEADWGLKKQHFPDATEVHLAMYTRVRNRKIGSLTRYAIEIDTPTYYARCTVSGCIGRHNKQCTSKIEAAEAWNKRASL